MTNEKILTFSASLFALLPMFIGFAVGGFCAGIATFIISLFLIKAVMRG